MKIYVITNGEYSDYHVITATTNEKLAGEIAKKYNADIEVYEDAASHLREVWFVKFDKSGNAVECRDESECEYSYENVGRCKEDCFGNVYVSVFAKSQRGAIKAAAERRAKFLAEKFGIA
jgi:hypothetical protein